MLSKEIKCIINPEEEFNLGRDQTMNRWDQHSLTFRRIVANCTSDDARDDSRPRLDVT